MNVKRLERTTKQIEVDGVSLELSTLQREGLATPILFLHGFGGTKEDYADIIQRLELNAHSVLAYDAPGCGQSVSSDLSKNSIPFLLNVARTMLDDSGIERFHLVGHSMGGLTSLLLAEAESDRLVSFTNIEGNVAPEDCFLSRQIFDYPESDAELFFNDFIERVADSRFASSALYSASLRHKVHAAAVRPIFTSMVELSDNGALLDRYLAIPAPKMFVYGEQNNSLSYLSQLEKGGVELAEIPLSAHFPMYSNPPVFWQRFEKFIQQNEN